ncbi:radical SAM protein [Brachyspira intermedia]|uniref:radical SAM protein n=1 Tax=Brachyspira intermedia TaxID=84377 RepID=UPI0030060FEB
MKWINKGHEFDAIGNIFKQNKDLLFLGDIDKANRMKKHLSFLNANIDIIANPSSNDLYNIDLIGKTILIFGNCPYIEEYLISKFLRKNINYFIINELGDHILINYGDDFLTKYISIFALCAYDKVYMPSNNIVITTVCNLNCESCLNYNPYNKKTKHRDFEELKKDIDLYFKHVDKVGLLHITGGEPILYPYLAELIKYINDNYRDKINDFVMPTNNIKSLNNDLCQTFKESDMIIQIDNYLEQVPQHKNIFDENINKLREYDVNVEMIDAGIKWSWFKTYPPDYDYSLLNEEEQRKRFDYCGCIYSQIKNGRIYVCSYHSFAETAGIVEEDKNAYFDLSGEVNKKELIEFRLKYNNVGYVEFCKYCNGAPPLNNKTLEFAAKQAKGILEWDKTFKEIDYVPVDIKKIDNKIDVLEKYIKYIDAHNRLNNIEKYMNDSFDNINAAIKENFKYIDNTNNRLNNLFNFISRFIPTRKLKNKFKDEFYK